MIAQVLTRNEPSYQNFLQTLNVKMHDKKKSLSLNLPNCSVIFDRDKHNCQKNLRILDLQPHCLVH